MVRTKTLGQLNRKTVLIGGIAIIVGACAPAAMMSAQTGSDGAEEIVLAEATTNTEATETAAPHTFAPQLFGIYGKHSVHDCPLFNYETAKSVVAMSNTDLTPIMEKYGVTKVVDQYHSGLEHTLMWVVETNDPHALEEFTYELGVARWNELTFVPVRRFNEDVLPFVKQVHGLE